MINIPKFIRLTEIYTDRTELPLLLNTAFITSVKKAKHGDTMINIAGERAKHDKESFTIYFFVKETVEEVGAML